MPTLLSDLIIPISLVAMTVVSIWRMTSIIRGLTVSSARHDERNAEQRDRFFMQILEKQAVASDVGSAVSMANVHSNEHLRTHNMDLARDSVDEKEAAKAARGAELERKNRERTANAGKSTVEAFSQ